jgi:hypothetical protein
MTGLTLEERRELERRAAELDTVEKRAIFLALQTGKPMWLCEAWAATIKPKEKP